MCYYLVDEIYVKLVTFVKPIPIPKVHERTSDP
jgi:hypothetical protein